MWEGDEGWPSSWKQRTSLFTVRLNHAKDEATRAVGPSLHQNRSSAEAEAEAEAVDPQPQDACRIHSKHSSIPEE